MDTCTRNVLSICSGYGGIELGLEMVERTRTVCYVENEIGAASILAARMEDNTLDSAPVWSNLRSFDPEPWRGKVDIIAGGFPCQPHSVAGNQRGEDDPRELSGEVLRIAAGLGYPTLFLENVPGILRFYWDNIRPELRKMGYEVKEGLFTASETGAPHKRERLFILAYTDTRFNDYEEEKICTGRDATEHDGRELAYTQGTNDSACSSQKRWIPQQPRGSSRTNALADTRHGTGEHRTKLGNTQHSGLSPTPELRGNEKTGEERCKEKQESSGEFKGTNTPINASGVPGSQRRSSHELADSNNSGSREDFKQRQLRADGLVQSPGNSGEARSSTDEEIQGRRWAEDNQNKKLANSSIEGPARDGFFREEEPPQATRVVSLYPPGPTEHERWARLLTVMPEAVPALCRDADGASIGMDKRLRAIGNGVVPAVAAYAWAYLNRKNEL